jgi:hypothetical protein
MKAKLFKIIPILLQKSAVNPENFILHKKVEVSANDYLSNLKIKLPDFLLKIISTKISIKNIIWTKKQVTVETELNLQPLFKKVENYIQLDEASLVIKTDSKIISNN